MNITEKKLDNSMIELSIDIPAEKVELEYKSVFDQLKNMVKIDGFRKGKAPLNIVEKQYRGYADKEVAENLSKSVLFDAITEKQIALIVPPVYNYETISRGDPFSFKATLELPPKVKLAKYKDLPIDERGCLIKDDDVKFEIESMLEKVAEFKEMGPEKPIQMRDLVKLRVMRIDDKKDDVKTDDADFKEYEIIIGKSRDESALDKQIIGMKTGSEKDITVKYPKDYYIKDLAGQKAVYRVQIETVKEVIPPELNDEFAVKNNYENVSDMKAKIKERLDKLVAEKIKGEAKGKLLKEIIEKSDFEIPPSMIRSEVQDVFRKYQQRIGYSADNIEKFANDLGINYETLLQKLAAEALSSIKVTLTLMEIINAEELKASEEKYNEAIDRLTERLGYHDRSITEGFINDKQYREKIENDILFDEALDFIYNNSKIKKLKPVSFEELLRTE